MQKVKNRSGCSCCGACGTIAVTVRTCAGDALLSGADVTVYDDADVEVGTGTTDGTGIVTISIDAAGDYTVVVEKAGQATATVVVSATCAANTLTVRLGRVINVTVHGCFEVPAGLLPGVTVTATLGANVYSAVTNGSGVASIWVGANGTYSINIAAFDRYTAYVAGSAVVVGSCTSVAHFAFLGAASGFACCAAPRPNPDTLFLTDNAGTTTLTPFSGFLGNMGGSATFAVPAGKLTGPGNCATVVGPITVRIDYNFTCDSGSLTRRVTYCGGGSSFPDAVVNLLRDLADTANPANVGRASFTAQLPTSIAYDPYSASYAAFNRNGLNLGTTSVVE